MGVLFQQNRVKATEKPYLTDFLIVLFTYDAGEKLGVFAKVEKPVGLTVGSDG